jgi:hypothetical protein
MTRARSLLWSLPFALAAACGLKAARQEPRQNPPVTFSHAAHTDLGCVDCHQGIDKADSLAQRHMPEAAKCQECHQDQLPPKRDSEPHLTFSHADHLPLVDNDCKACHTQLAEPGQATPPAPAMSTCTACHNHQTDFAQARCTPCHTDLKRYPLKPIAAFSHDGNFLREHGELARNSATTCAQCHDQTYCAKCHTATTNPLRPSVIFPEKVEANFIHRGDYVSRHTVEASSDPASCRRCHGTAFCESCHQQQRLLPGSTNPRDPHPPGWAARGSGGQFHGDAAKQNIVSCAGCHDQGAGSTCVACHRPGGSGGNPHPAGWSSRHKASDQGRNPMCMVCHGG